VFSARMTSATSGFNPAASSAAHGLEPWRRAQHLDRTVVVADHSSSALARRELHHLVLVRARREHELPAVPELERHRTFAAHVAAVLAERMTNLGDRSTGCRSKSRR
jgi:hypothetical protein